MAEEVTGVAVTGEEFERAMSLPTSEWHRVRTLRYAGGLDTRESGGE